MVSSSKQNQPDSHLKEILRLHSWLGPLQPFDLLHDAHVTALFRGLQASENVAWPRRTLAVSSWAYPLGETIELWAVMAVLEAGASYVLEKWSDSGFGQQLGQ